jgi:hypothetical protein
MKKIEDVIKNGDIFKITLYPQNINYDVDEHQVQSDTRFAKWDSDCFFCKEPKTKNVSPSSNFLMYQMTSIEQLQQNIEQFLYFLIIKTMFGKYIK